MTCAKQVVEATIVGRSGRVYVGRNDCASPQEVCPRRDMPSNVGYHLCRDVFRQEGHAEVMAIRAAGDDSCGGSLTLRGHITVCPSCMSACDAAWIVHITVEGHAPH